MQDIDAEENQDGQDGRMETVGQSHEDLQQILDDLELCREAIQSSRLNRVGGANSDEHDGEEFLDNDDSFDSDDSSCESDGGSVDNDDYSDNRECSCCMCIRRANNDDFSGDSDFEDSSVDDDENRDTEESINDSNNEESINDGDTEDGSEQSSIFEHDQHNYDHNDSHPEGALVFDYPYFIDHYERPLRTMRVNFDGEITEVLVPAYMRGEVSDGRGKGSCNSCYL